jgi:hypothetical protein
MIRLTVLSLLLFALIFTSCVSFSTLQSAKVVEDKEVITGIGAIAIPRDDEIGCCGVEAYLRFSTFKNSDFGIKLIGFPGAGMITGDLKYQLLSDPFFLSFDLAYSYSAIEDLGSGSGIIPTVFVGSERIFGGAKIIYTSISIKDFFDSESNYSDNQTNIPGVFIGGVIGNKFRLLPVVNLYFSPVNDKSFFIYNLGVEYKFN